MSELPITYRGAVYPWHCDHVGHMNVAWYTGKFDEATWNLFNMLGITPSYLRTNNRGMAAVDQHTKYLRELHPGDVVYIRSEILELEGKRIRFRHTMYNGETDDLAATTELLGLHMDTTVRKTCDFADDIVKTGQALVTEHQGLADAQ